MSKIRLRSALTALAFGTGVSLAAAPGAFAQSDPSTQQLIERLTPPSATRGIRVPGAPDAAPPAQAPVQPAPIFAPPTQAQPSAPPAAIAGPVVAPPPRAAPPIAAGGKPAQPPRGQAAVRETTAPAGTAAVSISVFFPSGSATLTSDAERALAPLGQALTSAQLAAYRFRIEGHTDTVGDPSMNQTLSERRAAAVREYLIQRWGVSSARLEAIGLGETQLLVPTPDETPNPRNRRVQIVNLDG